MKSVHKQMLGHIVAHEIYINLPAHPKTKIGLKRIRNGVFAT